MLYRAFIRDSSGPNMSADEGLEAFECIMDLWIIYYIQWTRCIFSLFDRIKATNDANEAFILYRTLIFVPLGPNMSADVGLEEFEFLNGLAKLLP